MRARKIKGRNSPHATFRGGYGFAVPFRDGREVGPRVPFRNLILDQGLDQYATNLSGNLTRYMAIGTGTDDTQRDSSTTTASRSGTTVTASAGFFVASDVGSLIKWDTGEEAYITSFTSSTVVETTDSGAIASDEFTIWHVDQTQLTSEQARSGNYSADGGANGSSESAGVVTHKRTHLSNAAAGALAIAEIGFSPVSSAGANLFNRIKLASVVNLGIGDQLKCEINLELTQSPQTSTASNPADAGDWTTELDGNIQIEGYGLSAVPSSGGFVTGSMDLSGNALEPSHASRGLMWSESDALNSYGTAKQLATGTVDAVTATLSTYSNGDFFRDKTLSWGTGAGNMTFQSLLLGNLQTFNYAALRQLMTASATKDSDHTLDAVFRLTWGRTLTN